nr:unnamed protein product [Digitaria exilis]
MAGIIRAAEPGVGGEDLAGDVRVGMEAEVERVGVDGGGDARGRRGAEHEREGVGVGKPGGQRAHEAVEREGEVPAGTREVVAEELVPWDGAVDRRVVADWLIGGEGGEEAAALVVIKGQGRRGDGAKAEAV